MGGAKSIAIKVATTVVIVGLALAVLNRAAQRYPTVSKLLTGV